MQELIRSMMGNPLVRYLDDPAMLQLHQLYNQSINNDPQALSRLAQYSNAEHTYQLICSLYDADSLNPNILRELLIYAVANLSNIHDLNNHSNYSLIIAFIQFAIKYYNNQNIIQHVNVGIQNLIKLIPNKETGISYIIISTIIIVDSLVTNLITYSQHKQQTILILSSYINKSHMDLLFQQLNTLQLNTQLQIDLFYFIIQSALNYQSIDIIVPILPNLFTNISLIPIDSQILIISLLLYHTESLNPSLILQLQSITINTLYLLIDNNNSPLSTLKYLNISIQSKILNDSLHTQYQKFFIYILPHLQSTPNEQSNYLHNPNDYVQYQTQLLNNDQLNDIKSMAITALNTIAQNCQGALTFIIHFALDILNYLNDKSNYVIETSQPFITTNLQQLPFFKLPDEEKEELSFFILTVLHQNVNYRNDLKPLIEQFIQRYLTYYSKTSNHFLKFRMLLLLQAYMPMLFLKKEYYFRKILKFCFKMLSPAYDSVSLQLQVSCQGFIYYRIQAIQTLVSFFQDRDTLQKLDFCLTDLGNEFCYFIAHSTRVEYYEFVKMSIHYSNTIVELFLDKIVSSLQIRIQEAIYKNDKTIIITCLNILDDIVSMNFCLQLAPLLEPALTEFCQVFLKTQLLWDYLDELFNICTKFISFVSGSTNLLYIIFNSIPDIPFDKLSIFTVLKLYFDSTVNCGNILKSQPNWINMMIDHLNKFLNQMINSHQDKKTLVKFCLLFQALYQFWQEYFSPVIIDYLIAFMKLLQKYHDLAGQKLLGCIFTPIIMELNYLNNETIRQIVITSTNYVCELFERNTTLFNLKMQLQILCVIITKIDQLYLKDVQDEQCFKYLKLQLNIMMKNLNNEENRLEEVKVENRIEKSVSWEELPLLYNQREMQSIKESIKFVKNNLIKVWERLQIEENENLQQIYQTEQLNFKKHTEYRKIMKPQKRKNVIVDQQKI